MKIIIVLIVYLTCLSCVTYNESQISGYWAEEGQEHNIHHFLDGKLNIRSEAETVEVIYGSIMMFKYQLVGNRINIEYLETKTYKKYKNKPDKKISYEPFTESGFVDKESELKIISVDKHKMILSNNGKQFVLVKSEPENGE